MSSAGAAPRDLLTAAVAARQHAYAPYSGFAVGAAVRAEDGTIFVGANVENASYPIGTCAEAGAIAAMVAEGGRRIVEVLIVAESEGVVTPCGACRQRLAEFADARVPVHAANSVGIRATFSVGQLLPAAFDLPVAESNSSERPKY